MSNYHFDIYQAFQAVCLSHLELSIKHVLTQNTDALKQSTENGNRRTVRNTTIHMKIPFVTETLYITYSRHHSTLIFLPSPLISNISQNMPPDRRLKRKRHTDILTTRHYQKRCCHWTHVTDDIRFILLQPYCTIYSYTIKLTVKKKTFATLSCFTTI